LKAYKSDDVADQMVRPALLNANRLTSPQASWRNRADAFGGMASAASGAAHPWQSRQWRSRI